MSTQPTEAEILSAFRDFMNKRGQGPHQFRPGFNPPGHVGLVDQNFVRPNPTEYPKMMHHPTGLTKVVNSEKEEKALEKAWSVKPTAQKSDWKTKVGEVTTQTGLSIKDHHVAFLQQEGVEVKSKYDAKQFLDRLNNEEQEQFFREAEMQEAPVASTRGQSKAPRKARAKKAA